MENSNIKKDLLYTIYLSGTPICREIGVCWPPLSKKNIWKSELLQTRGLKQFKASALDIQHGFNPQILTISITSSCECPPFGYPTLHHWNRQHQNWAKHGRYEQKQPPKSHALNAWLVKKTRFLWPISNSITTTQGWVKNSPPKNDPTNQGVVISCPSKTHQVISGNLLDLHEILCFLQGSNSKQPQQCKAHILLSIAPQYNV